MSPFYKPVYKTLLIVGFYFLQISILSAQKIYYVSSTGNDNNNGTSQQTAWKTLEKVNTTTFKPADKILFEANNAFNGTLSINNSGTLQQQILFGSYGNGKAIINAGNVDGIKGLNVSNIHITDFIVKGSGVATNKGNGILFHSDDTINNPQNIIIDKCDVSGFHDQGIAVGCGERENIKGYKNVRILNCTAFENGQAGISSYGSYTGFQNMNFYIAHCKAFNNRGIPGKIENHSGNGIVMGEVDSLLIEYCEAYENGADNSSEAGGPVGIWVWMCKNAVIQHCISHDNHAGLTKDGGGFDIDGGSSFCIIQYNYSYNNEGAGYLLAEYGALFPFTNNIIRFNISENDGRKNSYGGIVIWGASADYKVTNCRIYNNTIYSDDKNVVNGTPAAITLMGPHFKNIIVANNILAIKGKVNFINADNIFDSNSIWLLFNDYYSYSKNYTFKFGNLIYNSLQNWLAIDSSQEKDAYKKSCFYNIDPKFSGNIPKQKDTHYKISKTSMLRKVSSDVTWIHGWSIILPYKDYNCDDLHITSWTRPGAYAK
jgi:hypothetical protein